ncbi:MAG: MaoC family dehydratase N-terminal domain-containing protein [Myxococcota bacterium]
MAFLDIDRSLIGQEFDTTDFVVSEEEILTYARACGETDPRYSDPSHPDFQAPPTLTSKYLSRRVLPKAFPYIGARGFDAGKTTEILAPVRPGDTLTAHSRIADIYEKTGRSGPMVFIVHRMEFENQHGQPVSIVDWRLVRLPDDEGAKA